MKLRYQLIWIACVFMFFVAPLFYILFWKWYLPNKIWNDQTNKTKCLVTEDHLDEIACGMSNGWSQNEIKCYNGIATLKYLNTTKNFDVAQGSYNEVNQTLSQYYPKGSCVGCLVQITNTSDFDIQYKSVVFPLFVTISITGCSTLGLIAWGTCAILAQREQYIDISHM